MRYQEFWSFLMRVAFIAAIGSGVSAYGQVKPVIKVSMTSAEISQNGFESWRAFSEKRRLFRKEALQCLESSHKKTCWSGLAQRIGTEKNAELSMCPDVQKHIQDYWAALQMYAGKMSASHVALNTQSIEKVVTPLLDRAKHELSAMADTGRCSGAK